MDKVKRAWIIAPFGACLLLLGFQPALAETQDCTNITAIPATISTQGVYCLKQHESAALASGAAITINVNNVTLDCNEFKIGNLAAGSGTNATGVQASGRINVTVRNCGIRGFRNGVMLTNGLYRVENNRFDQQTQSGITVSGDGSVLRGNEVVDTGGSTVPGIDEFVGINSSGDMDLIDNTVDAVVATGGSDGDVFGILTSDNDAGTIKGNRIRNLAADGSGSRAGIWSAGGNHVTIEGNTVVLNSPLIIGEAGIRCGDGLLLNGASRDNTILGTGLLNEVLALLNCSPAGGDFVNPL